MTDSPFLFIGLGNPGREYRDTRHNVGFMLIDRIAVRLNVSMTRYQHRALVAQGMHKDDKIILAKPQTFMNLSGQSVSALVKFYKIPHQNVIVAHDDLDLPFGTLRLRPGGGSAGQKGVASIIDSIGSKEFPRIRIGIGRPPSVKGGADYVLRPFSNADMIDLSIVLDKAADAAFTFVTEGIDLAMTKFNGVVDQDDVR
jgi:PTH1 family peptidyl-tRNA hydrolase